MAWNNIHTEVLTEPIRKNSTQSSRILPKYPNGIIFQNPKIEPDMH